MRSSLSSSKATGQRDSSTTAWPSRGFLVAAPVTAHEIGMQHTRPASCRSRPSPPHRKNHSARQLDLSPHARMRGSASPRRLQRRRLRREAPDTVGAVQRRGDAGRPALPARPTSRFPPDSAPRSSPTASRLARHVAVASNGDVYVTIEGTRPPRRATDVHRRPRPRAEAGVVRRAARHEPRRPRRRHQAHRVARQHRDRPRQRLPLRRRGQADRPLRAQRHGARSRGQARGRRERHPDGRRPSRPQHRHRRRRRALPQRRLEDEQLPAEGSRQRVAGVDPCTELETRAGMWKYDANKTGQAFSAKERFATGIRNGMGIAIAPDGKVYSTQHGRDQLNRTGRRSSPLRSTRRRIPPRSCMQVNQGDDFGWPYCYYAVEQKKLVDAPEYGGDGKKTDRCSSTRRRRSPPSRDTGRRCRCSSTRAPRSPSTTATARSSPSTARGTARRSRRRATASSSSRSPTAPRPATYETFANGFAARRRLDDPARHREAPPHRPRPGARRRADRDGRRGGGSTGSRTARCGAMMGRAGRGGECMGERNGPGSAASRSISSHHSLSASDSCYRPVNIFRPQRRQPLPHRAVEHRVAHVDHHAAHDRRVDREMRHHLLAEHARQLRRDRRRVPRRPSPSPPSRAHGCGPRPRRRGRGTPRRSRGSASGDGA